MPWHAPKMLLLGGFLEEKKILSLKLEILKNT